MSLLSLRNLPQCTSSWPDQLNTYDVLVNDVVLFTERTALDDVPRRPDRRAEARRSPSAAELPPAAKEAAK